MSHQYRVFISRTAITTRFFISNTVISNAGLKLIKSQANSKQNMEAELLLLENYSHSSSTFSRGELDQKLPEP